MPPRQPGEPPKKRVRAVEERLTLHLRSSLDGTALGCYRAVLSEPVARIAEEAVRLAKKSDCVAKLMLAGCDQPLDPSRALQGQGILGDAE